MHQSLGLYWGRSKFCPTPQQLPIYKIRYIVIKIPLRLFRHFSHCPQGVLIAIPTYYRFTWTAQKINQLSDLFTTVLSTLFNPPACFMAVHPSIKQNPQTSNRWHNKQTCCFEHSTTSALGSLLIPKLEFSVNTDIWVFYK